MDWGSPLAALATALGIGLLIGAVRERQHGDVLAKAGVRTHALLALAGAVASMFGTPVLLVVLAALLAGALGMLLPLLRNVRRNPIRDMRDE